jgi:hypothetical protein
MIRLNYRCQNAYLFAAFVCHRAVDEQEFQIGVLVAEGAFGQVQGGRQEVLKQTKKQREGGKVINRDIECVNMVISYIQKHITYHTHTHTSPSPSPSLPPPSLPQIGEEVHAAGNAVCSQDAKKKDKRDGTR